MRPMEHHPHEPNPPMKSEVPRHGQRQKQHLAPGGLGDDTQLQPLLRSLPGRGHQRSLRGRTGYRQAFKLLDEIAEVGKPIIILTGGEPLLRKDIFDIAKHGDRLGLRMVMAPNGTLITPQVPKKWPPPAFGESVPALTGPPRRSTTNSGGRRCFRCRHPGIEYVKAAGIEFQINTTITKTNLDQIPRILELAERLGAVAHHIFLLVPTGRGKYIVDQAIDAKEYETTLNWFYDQREKTPLQLKATCAPHYYRILRQRAKAEGKTISISNPWARCRDPGLPGRNGILLHFPHRCRAAVRLYGCSMWRHHPIHLRRNLENSPVFLKLRDFKQLEGKCGACEYRAVCGGCRARAFEATGNYMAEEPLCAFQPEKASPSL
jgi:radical SAM protein with 4Fe4S-binding SPASM domain